MKRRTRIGASTFAMMSLLSVLGMGAAPAHAQPAGQTGGYEYVETFFHINLCFARGKEGVENEEWTHYICRPGTENGPLAPVSGKLYVMR